MSKHRDEMERARRGRRNFVLAAPLTIGTALLIFKAAGVIDWSWAVVTAPLWIPMIFLAWLSGAEQMFRENDAKQAEREKSSRS